jgi:hypothetical protein
VVNAQPDDDYEVIFGSDDAHGISTTTRIEGEDSIGAIGEIETISDFIRTLLV